MILTGKCKDYFEKWIENKKFSILHDVGDIQMNIVPLGDMFEQLHFSMQYGVLIDFFDSVGLYIDDWGETTRWEWAVHKIPNEWWDAEHSVITRQEARTKAIEKANEIYNEQ